MSRDLVLGAVQALDANAAAQNNRVSVGFAANIVGAWQTLRDILPLKDRIFTVFDQKVKGESTGKSDLWSSRTVSLAPTQVVAPVTIAIWDSGTDPKVLAGHLWTNPREKPNGKDDDGDGFVDDINGIAFDADYRPSTGMLRPMDSADLSDIAGKLTVTKGSLDLQASIETTESAAFRKAIASLKPDQVMPFALQQQRLVVYLHGTTTAYTSVIGNPGARVLVARSDQRISQVPEPVDEKVADAMAAYAKTCVDYFKNHGVRVVNMSWRFTEPQIDATLTSIEPDPVKRNDRAQAIFTKINTALEDAFKSAPDILFVAGAGNEDEDVDFVRSLPAGINLPNVMTVGAVDIALQPASFTSYGKSIDVYANGFEVPAKVPGGMSMNVSGTSIAAPQVTNLAAKLLAVNPRLTATAVRAIIEETATSEGDKKLKVINPRAALAEAKTPRIPRIPPVVAVSPPVR
jgi:subtilisin family serine protease